MILDVQLWELGNQRLHQGLSEIILVNTMTDVREFKNISCVPRLYSKTCLQRSSMAPPNHGHCRQVVFVDR